MQVKTELHTEGMNAQVQCPHVGIALLAESALQEDPRICHPQARDRQEEQLLVPKLLLRIREGPQHQHRDLIRNSLSISQNITGLHQLHHEQVPVADRYITVQTDRTLQAITARG